MSDSERRVRELPEDRDVSTEPRPNVEVAEELLTRAVSLAGPQLLILSGGADNRAQSIQARRQARNFWMLSRGLRPSLEQGLASFRAQRYGRDSDRKVRPGKGRQNSDWTGCLLVPRSESLIAFIRYEPVFSTASCQTLSGLSVLRTLEGLSTRISAKTTVPANSTSYGNSNTISLDNHDGNQYCFPDAAGCQISILTRV